MKANLFLLPSFIAAIILISCDTVDDRLVVINNHSNPIAVECSQDSILTNYNLWQFYVEKQIKPNTSRNIDKRGAWPHYIRSSNSQKLYLFIFDIDTIIKYKDMDFVIKNALYVSRIGVTESDLESRNWKINY